MITILTPAENTALTTLARVKDDLDISGSGDDGFLESQIADYSAAINGYCGRVLAREEVRQIWNLNRPVDGLPLARWPNVDVTAVTIGGTIYATSYVEADDGLLYRLDARGNRTAWCGKVVVDYAGGYLLPDDDERDLPASIELACVLLIKAAWHGRKRDPLIRSDSTEGLSNVSFQVGARTASGWPEDVEALLRPHRVLV